MTNSAGGTSLTVHPFEVRSILSDDESGSVNAGIDNRVRRGSVERISDTRRQKFQ